MINVVENKAELQNDKPTILIFGENIFDQSNEFYNMLNKEDQ